MTPTIAIGVGFRKACASETIVALVRRARAVAAAECGWTAACPGVLATIAEKDRPVLREAAAKLGLSVVVLPKQALADTGDRTTVVSEVARACFGIPSVAEAAALAAAGSGSRLLVSRLAVKDATCAIAIPEGAGSP